MKTSPLPLPRWRLPRAPVREHCRGPRSNRCPASRAWRPISHL